MSTAAVSVVSRHTHAPKVTGDSWSTRCQREATGTFYHTGLSPAQEACEKIIDSQLADGILVALISFSFVVVIFDADYKGEPPYWVWASNVALLCIYSIEAAVRIFVLRSMYFCSIANILDLLLIVSDITSMILDAMGNDVMPSLIILRVVRLSRLFRTVKALVRFPQLALLVKGFINSLGAVAYGVIFMLLNLIFWSVCAVYFIHPVNQRVSLAGQYVGCDRCEHAFETVMQSALTFVQQIIAGDSWGLITIPIIDESPATAVFFGLVFTSLHIVVLNLILAVIVDTAMRTSLECNEEVVKHKMSAFTEHANHLRQVCKEMDLDSSGDLTFHELLNGYDNNDTFRDLLNAMDVNKSDLALVFDILDTDSSGAVNHEEFIAEVFKMKSQDSHTLLVYIRHFVCKMHKDLRRHTCGLGGQGEARKDEDQAMTPSEAVQRKSEAVLLGAPAAPKGSAWRAQEEDVEATQHSTPVGSMESKVLECSAQSLMEELRMLQATLKDDLTRGMQELSQKADSHERLLASIAGSAPVLCGRMQETPGKADSHERLLAFGNAPLPYGSAAPPPDDGSGRVASWRQAPPLLQPPLTAGTLVWQSHGQPGAAAKPGAAGAVATRPLEPALASAWGMRCCGVERGDARAAPPLVP